MANPLHEASDLMDKMPVLRFDQRTIDLLGPEVKKYVRDLAEHRLRCREWVQKYCPEKMRGD